MFRVKDFMDNQGFAPSTAIRTAQRHVAQDAARVGKPVVSQGAQEAGQLAARAGVAASRARSPKEEALDKNIARADTVRSLANFPIMTVMMPALVASALGGIAGFVRRQRSAVVLGGTGHALMQGTRRTTMNAPFTMAADVVDAFAEKTIEVASKHGEKSRVAGWIDPITKKAASLRVSGEGMNAKAGAFFAPVKNAFFGAAEKIGVGAPVGKAAGFVGRLPVFAGIAVVAAGAGMTSIWLNRSKQSAEGKRALNELKADFPAGHPVLAEAQKIVGKQGARTAVSALMNSANEALFVAFEATPHMGMGVGMASMMGAQVALPALGDLMVAENPVLDASVRLKQIDAKEIQVPAGQHVHFIRQMIGAMPQVAAKGGVFNRLGGAMAQKLVADGATYPQVVALLNDPQKFDAMARECSTAMDAAKTSPAPAANAPVAAAPALAHNDNDHLRHAPKAQIQAMSAANDGTVHARAVGQSHG
jgi:hypothetical protein